MIVNERKINFLHLGLYSDSECGIIINVKSSTKKIIIKKKKVEKFAFRSVLKLKMWYNNKCKRKQKTNYEVYKNDKTNF